MTNTAKQVRSERPPIYAVHPDAADDDAIITRALLILSTRVAQGPVCDSPRTIKDYLTVRAAGLQREVFAVVLLDTQHRMIGTHDMFAGTLGQTSVYPREVVKLALAHNAGAVILTHNHPSGSAEPSRADEFLTQSLKAALALVDVRVIDHIVTGAGVAVSFAERGLL